MTSVQLPPDMPPRDGRFGCGPSKIRPQQLRALDETGLTLMGTSHRKKPVKNLVQDVREGLAALLRLPEGYEIILGNGGASAFWDAAAFGLVDRRSQNLSFGEFGNKFAHACAAPWLEAPDVRTAEPGTSAQPHIQEGIDVYAWPHNETSTGVSTPVKRVGDRGDALTVIDGTSAVGGIDFEITECDVYYFSPQKNLGSDGGLWFAAVSPQAIERIERLGESDRYIPAFLSLTQALSNSRLQQTLNTPAVATLVLLREQLSWINGNGGLAWAAQRTGESSEQLYIWADAHPLAQPFVAHAADRSPVVVTIDFDESIDAAWLAASLRDNGIVDVEPYRKLGRNQLRVATFVSVEPSDITALIACIDYTLERR